MTGFERITWFCKGLKANNYPCCQKFMAEFEVSKSTFKRDIAFLRDRLGAPVVYDEKRKGYYISDSSFELPAFWFEPRQLLIIAAVCRQLEQFTRSSAIKSLRDRLLEMITVGNIRRLDVFSFESAACISCDNANFDTLSQAILMERLVSITYRDGKNGKITSREVEPYRLHNYAGSWYLIGFCRLRKAIRNFQLVRIIELHVIDEETAICHFNIDEYIAGSFGIFKGQEVEPVVLRFNPQIARLIREQCWHPDQIMVDESDGSLLLTIPVADLTEIRMKALQYGSQVEVVSPPELRRQVAAEAKAMCGIYDGLVKSSYLAI